MMNVQQTSLLQFPRWKVTDAIITRDKDMSQTQGCSLLLKPIFLCHRIYIYIKCDMEKHTQEATCHGIDIASSFNWIQAEDNYVKLTVELYLFIFNPAKMRINVHPTNSLHNPLCRHFSLGLPDILNSVQEGIQLPLRQWKMASKFIHIKKGKIIWKQQVVEVVVKSGISLMWTSQILDSTWT